MKGDDAFYEETGGIRTGKSIWLSSNFSYPLAKIEIYRDKLILSYPLGKIEFKKEDITFIENYKFSPFSAIGIKINLARGIKINHKKLEVSPFIFFFSWNPEQLISKLKDFGYETK